MKPIAFILLFAPAISIATPLAGATGDYANDLGQIKGTVDALRGYQSACTKKFPSLKEKFSSAMLDWDTRNRFVLDELNERLDEHLKELSSGDAAFVERRKIEMQEIHRKKDAALMANLSSVPPDKAKATCSRLADDLNTDLSDLEDLVKFQLETVRRRTRSVDLPNKLPHRAPPV
jgi:hypothetical protein